MCRYLGDGGREVETLPFVINFFWNEWRGDIDRKRIRKFYRDNIQQWQQQ
jgi:hypothetical protein